MPAIKNPKLEAVAQELANGKSTEEASRAAGYPDGSSFKPNAKRRAQRPDVKARVAELRAPGVAKAEEHVAINTEYVLTKASDIVNVKKPASAVKVSDQVAALNLIAKVIGILAPDKLEHTGKDGGKIVIEWAKPGE
jgi:hypothetical protein